MMRRMKKSLVKFTHKPFLLMGMMACLTMSCSQDMESNIEKKTTLGDEVSLNFSTNEHGTRGTMYDAINFIADDDQFGVQGYTTDKGFGNMGNVPNFIDNGHTTKSGKVTAKKAAVWKNAKEYVQMVGTYPFLEGNNSIVKTGRDTYKVTFTPETDASKQKDLMLGKRDIALGPPVEGGDRDPVDITLYHALTAVNFTLGNKRTTGLKIVGIKLSGVAGKSECEANLATNTFTWDVKEPEKDYFLKVDGNGIRTTVPNMTQVTGVKDGKGKYDNFSFLMIPQKLGPNAKATIYLEKDTNPNEEDDKANQYPNFHENRKKKIVTLKLDGKEWKANQPINYIIEDKQYNTDFEYVFKTDKSSNGECVSGDISFTGRKRSMIIKNGQLVKARTDEEKQNAKTYYTKIKGGTPGVFKISGFQSFAAGIYLPQSKHSQYLFQARQTWGITKYEWTYDDNKRESSTTIPGWLTYTYTDKNTPRKFEGDFTFTTNPNTCPKKLTKIEVTLKQAGNDKELKFILSFSLPFPYETKDIKFPIPVDDEKKQNQK